MIFHLLDSSHLLPTYEWMGICIVSTVWTMMIYAAVNIHVQAFVYTYVFISFGI
jgi:hypothetical protein